MKKQFLALLLLPITMLAFIPGKKTDATGAGTWKALKTKNDPGARSECSMAAVDGQLYLMGGDGGDTLPVERLDPKTLTWTKLGRQPSIMHHLQLVTLDKKIYALEAFSTGNFPKQEPTARVQIYDTQTDAWSQGGVMPAPRRRAAAGAVAYKGKLYLVDGIQHGHQSGTNNMFDVYDPATAAWSTLPNSPHIRDHCFAAVIGDKMYVAGGRNTSFRDPTNKLNFFSQTVLDVDCYDFITGTWSTLDAKLPLGTGGGNVVVVKNKLYYMGGERATAMEHNAPRKNTYFLDPSAPGGQWQETDSLKQARNGVAAAVVDGKIYVAGGVGGGLIPGFGMRRPMPGGNQPPPSGGLPANDTSRGPMQGGARGRGPGGASGSIAVEVFTVD